MKVAVYRKAHFNAAHRLYNPSWTHAQNNEVFGLCNNVNWHGHNYDLIVKVIGDINPDTGYVVDMKYLKQIIKEEIEDRFDHKNLNLDCPEFEGINPTAENIVVVIYKLLRNRLTSDLDLQVRLYETERNFVEFPA